MAYLGFQSSLPCFEFSHSFSDIHIRGTFLFHLANQVPLEQRGGFKLSYRKTYNSPEACPCLQTVG